MHPVKSISFLSGSLRNPAFLPLSASLPLINYVLVEALGSVYTNPINVKSSGSLLMHIRVDMQTKQWSISRFREQSSPD